MFLSELFTEDEVADNRIALDDLSHLPKRFSAVIQRLAKFHRVKLAYDQESHTWFADNNVGLNPFMKDVKHITSAAGMGTMHEDGGDDRKLVAVFRKGPTLDNPKAVASKIYLWKTGPGDNTYEMEVGQDRKRIPVKLSFAQIRQTLAKKGFNESITRMGKLLIEARREWDDPVDLLSVRGTDRDALGRNLPKKAKAKELKKDIINAKGKHGPKGKLPEASMTKSEPSKKESVFNKGVEKSLGQQVAVIVLDHPDSVAYGVFKRIGETGLCHIKLNGGKLPGWAAGDMIAVRPSEVYSTWDPRLQGMTAVHREYDDVGNKTVREGDKGGISKGDETKFHKKLDTLVHDTFGKRNDE